MLRSLKGMINYRIRAADGDIGHLHEVHFDDANWTVRYLIVDTGRWLPGRKVHLTPMACDGPPKWNERVIPVAFSKDMVKNSPDIDTDKPVSRQKEIELAQYYQWPYYWENDLQSAAVRSESLSRTATEIEGDPRLRSSEEVRGYRIHADDGEIGHVSDFIIEDEDWSVRYLVVSTRNILPGKKVLVAPLWIRKIDWADSLVVVSLTREEIKNSPPYNPDLPINRDYEEVLYDYYGRPKYWITP